MTTDSAKLQGTWSRQRVVAITGVLVLLCAEVICIISGASAWLLVFAAMIAGGAIAYATWTAWTPKITWWSGMRPWDAIPEIAHLDPATRRSIWRYCRDEGVAPRISMAPLLRTLLPSYAVLILYAALLLLFPTSGFVPFLIMGLGTAYFPMQVVMLVRLRRRWIRKAISREVLAQFLGREFPAELTVMGCPRCDYNLIAKSGESATCPECGTPVAEPGSAAPSGVLP